MDSDDSSGNIETVRRTRSGRSVKPAPVPKQTRKTRKKMVLVEVEVSDEEDVSNEPAALELENSDNAVEAGDPMEDTLESGKDMNELNSDYNSYQDTEDLMQEESSRNNYENRMDSEFDENSAQLHDEENRSNEQFVENEQLNLDESLDSTNERISSRNDLSENGEMNDNEEQMDVDDVGIKMETSVSEIEQDEDHETEAYQDEEGNLEIDEGEGSHGIKTEQEDDRDKSSYGIKTESDEVQVKGSHVMVIKPKEHVENAEKSFEVRVKDENDDNSPEAADPDTEVISEDELPIVQVVKVPETEEVSDEELPGPKRAELPADTEVVSEDELPTVKKEGGKRKLAEGEYDPGSPTSENETPAKKQAVAELETGDADESVKKEGENSVSASVKKQTEGQPRKLPELDKYWKAVNDDPTDFTGWTYLLQYVDQENDMEAAREAYDAFLSHYPYCYGYWRKYADYEKRKGNKKKCEEVFERGLKAIPLSVDLWIHYLTYTRSVHPDDETYLRSQFERALTACGLEFRSDRLWDGYIKWESEAKRMQNVTRIYDRLLATPTQGYTNHFDNFQEHVASNPPNKILEVDEFLALRKEVKHMLKHDVTTELKTADVSAPDVPPGDEPVDGEAQSSDEETNAIRERIVSIRRKIHKNTVNSVTSRWNFEEGIKRPYFHVKPLERCQLKNWKEYLDYEIEQGDQSRIIILFERCLIACALYEDFWLRFVHYLEELKDEQVQPRIRDVYERACTIHHLKKPNLHLQWAMFEESVGNFQRAGEILVNLEKSVPNLLQVAYRRINLERRRGDQEKCSQLYEHYISSTKNKLISTNLSIKYSRFCLKVCKDIEKSLEILNNAVAKDSNNPRLYLQLIDLQLQRDGISEEEVLKYIDAFLEKENVETDQKVLFAQRKLEFLEDFGSDIHSVQKAYDEYQKYYKLNKENKKKKGEEGKTNDAATSGNKKEKNPPLPTGPSSSYGNYSSYGNSNSSANAGSYSQYSGSQTQGQYGTQYGTSYGQNTDQFQHYQNWQYPPSGYGSYNQWSGYSSGYY